MRAPLPSIGVRAVRKVGKHPSQGSADAHTGEDASGGKGRQSQGSGLARIGGLGICHGLNFKL